MTKHRPLLLRSTFIAALTLCASPALAGPDFVRGRVTSDGEVDISDRTPLLAHLFLGSGGPDCPDAADVDDDGAIVITDAVYLLAYLFLGGSPTPAPFPVPGPDPTPDDLPCAEPTITDLSAAPSALVLASIGRTGQLVVTGTVAGAPPDPHPAASGPTPAPRAP